MTQSTYRTCLRSLFLSHPHGHFYGPNSKILGSSATCTRAGALTELDALIAAGHIPAADREEIYEQITAAFEALGIRYAPADPSKDGRHSFRRAQGEGRARGYFVMATGEIVSNDVDCSLKALMMLEGAAGSDIVTKEEYPLVMNDIHEAGLPDNAPYRGPFTHETVADERGVLRGRFRCHDGDSYLVEDELHIPSKAIGLELLDACIIGGEIHEDERARLVDEINASKLPDVDPPEPEYDMGSMLESVFPGALIIRMSVHGSEQPSGMVH